jgi:hypothetical protein
MVKISPPQGGWSKPEPPPITEVKIVPKSDPNANGEWVRVEVEYHPLRSFGSMERVVSEIIPNTHFMVAYRYTKEKH